MVITGSQLRGIEYGVFLFLEVVAPRQSSHSSQLRLWRIECRYLSGCLADFQNAIFVHAISQDLQKGTSSNFVHEEHTVGHEVDAHLLFIFFCIFTKIILKNNPLVIGCKKLNVIHFFCEKINKISINIIASSTTLPV